MNNGGEDPDFRQFVVDCLDDETQSADISVNESSYSGKKLSTNSLVPGHLSDPKYHNSDMIPVALPSMCSWRWP